MGTNTYEGNLADNVPYYFDKARTLQTKDSLVYDLLQF